MVTIALQPLGLGLLTTSSPIVPSLYRLKPSIFKLLKPLHSHMLFDLVQPFLRAEVSLDLLKFLYANGYYYVTAFGIRIIHSSVTDCTFTAKTET